MTLPTLHVPLKDSPETSLTDSINTLDTILKVVSATAFQTAGITRLSIGIDAVETETVTVVQYLSSTQIEVTRGSGAKSWGIGAKVSRVLTAEDITDIHDYLTGLNSGMVTNGNAHNHDGGDGAQIPTNGIADNSINNLKLIDNCISTDKIIDSAISTEKLIEGSVTPNKISIFDRCRVFRNTNISIPNSTPEDINFNAEEYDTNSMHSNTTNNQLIRINTAGVYIVQLNVVYAVNSVGHRSAVISLPGFVYIAGQDCPASASETVALNVSVVRYFNVGDTLCAYGYQTSGGALNIMYMDGLSPYFSATLLGR